MVHLKKFANIEAYEAGKGDLTAPSFSFIENTNEVIYDKDWGKYYLIFEALEDGSFSWLTDGPGEWERTIQYSKDLETWVNWMPTGEAEDSAVEVHAGEKLYIKGNNPYYYDIDDTEDSCSFSSTCRFKAYGNVYALLGDNEMGRGAFGYLFNGCELLVSAPELPATTLADYCYHCMFNGCASLTAAPELPATTLAYSCYANMFDNCTSLTAAPALPATTLADYCYASMFRGCTSLAAAPELPATTAANSCYRSMFEGCTSLTTAPALPATTLAEYCYQSMFRNCSSLNYIKCLATNPSNTYTGAWVNGVASSGTFVKAASASWLSGVNGIPNGWTVVDA